MTTTVFVTVRYDTNSDTPAEVLGVYLNHGDAKNAIEEDHEAYFEADAQKMEWEGNYGTANDVAYEIFHRPLND